MKAALLLGLVLLPLGALCAGEPTAYSALRVLGKRDGQDILNHVVEVRGRDGKPGPAVWKVLISEPRALGGIREVEIKSGKITSERTPTNSRGLGGPMNFNQLNLDSEGAFTIANQEAQKISLPFDRIDYYLRAGTNGGAPVWQLELNDGKIGHVGTFEIAADSGTVLRKQIDTGHGTDNDRNYLDERQHPPRSTPRDGDDDRGYAQSGGHDPDFGHRIKEHLKKRLRQLGDLFNGHSTDDR
jgi:hypothetical protein